MKGIEKLTADVNVDEFVENYVDIERFEALCQECDNYGKNWNCPPFDFDVEDVWNSYSKLKIIAFKMNFDDEELSTNFSDRELEFVLKKLERMKVRLMNEIYALEDENSLALFLGNCNLCMKCTREFGMPCKIHVNISNYGIEGLRESTWFVDHVKIYHRTFSNIVNTLIEAGFTIEKMIEPLPTKELLQDYPDYKDLLHKPDFLLLKARK